MRNVRNYLSGIAVSCGLGLILFAGCQGFLQGAFFTNPGKSGMSIAATLAKVPVEVMPGVAGVRLNTLNIAPDMPRDEIVNIALALSAGDVTVEVDIPADPATAPQGNEAVVSLTIGDPLDPTPCETGVDAGQFTLSIADDGTVTGVASQPIILSGAVIDLLRGGEFVLCTEIDANFVGRVTINQTMFDVTIRLGGSANGNSNGDDDSDDSNDNDDSADDDNGNSSPDDSANDNMDGDDNGNMNSDDTGNMNGDDNGNMNSDDNGNMNGDDNGNMNGGDNENSNG